MPQSLSQVIIHLVFSTKNRTPLLDENIQNEMHLYLAATIRDQAWECYRIGGVSDHIHLLLRQPRTEKISDLVGHIKRNSTKWIHTKGDHYKDFAWQDGYGAFSIGYSQIEEVTRYINRQEEHHRKMTFQEEYRIILERYHVDYDEQYVWD
jgi:REP element-mobilizing transposase RayT